MQRVQDAPALLQDEGNGVFMVSSSASERSHRTCVADASCSSLRSQCRTTALFATTWCRASRERQQRAAGHQAVRGAGSWSGHAARATGGAWRQSLTRRQACCASAQVQQGRRPTELQRRLATASTRAARYAQHADLSGGV
jgi:hypothetical protein